MNHHVNDAELKEVFSKWGRTYLWFVLLFMLLGVLGIALR